MEKGILVYHKVIFLPRLVVEIVGVELVYFIDCYEHGSYSLADDQLAADAANNGFCLDVLLFFTDEDAWPENAGGFISYVGVNEPNEVNLNSRLDLPILDTSSSPDREFRCNSFSRARGTTFHEVRQLSSWISTLLRAKLFILWCFK